MYQNLMRKNNVHANIIISCCWKTKQNQTKTNTTQKQTKKNNYFKICLMIEILLVCM